MIIIDAKTFGAALRRRRKKLNYTQTFVSEVSGFSVSFLSDLEQRKSTAELGRAIRLANLLEAMLLSVCGVSFAAVLLCAQARVRASTVEAEEYLEGVEPQDMEGGNINTGTDRIGALSPGDIVDMAQVTGREESYFVIYPIEEGDAVYERINGKSYRENDDIALDELRYLKLLHYNFEHELQVGELIVNEDVADDVRAIFRELYDAEYEIQSMRLVDDYWTGNATDSDTASIEENNSSAFNYREATGGGKLSNHATGRAIDINPQQNPYVYYQDGAWTWDHENAAPYIDRDSGELHMIAAGDVCCSAFAKYGFSWGGEWGNPLDYQHFEKE